MITKYQELAKHGNIKTSRFVSSAAVILYFYLIIGGIIASIPIIYTMVTNRDTLFDPIMETDPMGFIDKYVGPIPNFIFSNLSIYCMLAGAVIAIKFIHNRPLGTVFNYRGKIKWLNFWIGFGVFGILLFIGTGVDYIFNSETYSVSFDPDKFWVMLPVILIMTPIQTTAEEIVFRGYVIQSFGLKIKNGLVLSVISGVIFTLPHLANPEIYAASELGVFSTICMVLNYFIYGVMLAMITIRTNSLEAAVGVHAVNNLFCFIIVSYPDSVLPTNTIFFTSELNPVAGFVSSLITAILFYIIAVFIIGKTDKTLKVTG